MRTITALLTLTLLTTTGCKTGAFAQPSVEFTKAARGFVDTVGTEFAAYVEADDTLSPAQKLNRTDTVGDFEFAVRMAEAANSPEEVE
jgi:hypothetical protein